MKRRFVWLATLSILATAACNGSDGEAGRVRFIADDPGEILDATLRRDHTVVGWTDPAADDAWTVEAVEPRRTRRFVETLSAAVEVEAETVHTLVVGLRPMEPLPPRARIVELTWNPPAPSSAEAPRVRASLGTSTEARFPLRGHPSWTGRIERIRLHLPVEAAAVEEIELVTESWSDHALARSASGWKVGLGNDLRNALPGPPGLDIERDVRIPSSATLLFATGRLGNAAADVDFRVLFHEDGDETPQVLFETQVVPDSEAEWTERSVDLSPFAGRRGRLVLRTESEADLHPTEAVPLWANPEIVVADRASDPRPNVVLVSIDTLRADRMSLYGYARVTTPNLEVWSEDAAVFERAIAQSPWTLPSHVSMLTGLDPFHHGVNHSSQTIPLETTLLAERLRAAGYRTLAVTGGTLLHPRYGFAQGFDRYWFFDGNRAKLDELGRELDRAVEWLRAEGDAPFFLFFHTYEVHTPFRSRSPYYERMSDLPPVVDIRSHIPDASEATGYRWRSDVDDLQVVAPADFPAVDRDLVLAAASDAYDSGIAHVDHELQRLFAAIDQGGMGNRTATVLTSDHGELFGEHGGLVNHRYLVEENVRVPLVVKLPAGARTGHRVPQQVRSIDIVPTLLDLAGIEPPGTLQGRSLLPFLGASTTSEPGRDAWTYTPETNYGVALRLGSGSAFAMNDTAWLAREEPVAPLGDSRTSPDQLTEARRRIPDALRALRGARMRLVNRSSRRFTGSVTGPAAKFNVVKAAALPCDCVSYEPWTLRFEVPPDTDFTLHFAPGATPELTLTLDGDAATRTEEWRQPYDRAAILDGVVLGRTESRWQPVRGPRRPDAYVEIRWEGAPPPESDGAPPVDEDLRRRLQALGYVR